MVVVVVVGLVARFCDWVLSWFCEDNPIFAPFWSFLSILQRFHVEIIKHKMMESRMKNSSSAAQLLHDDHSLTGYVRVSASLVTKIVACPIRSDPNKPKQRPDTMTRKATTTASTSTPTSFIAGNHRRIVAALVILTCIKILCMPAYRSTDFDVHRNWLAVTRHLPIAEWYFDDVNGTTVHTLDYPPGFAYFEYILSRNPITNLLLRAGAVDDRCFALLGDHENEPSDACVVFQRSTVIVSDVVLWIGAYTASLGDFPVFLLIVTNPGLVWLDHVHFQYNGMLLGILLASLGLLVRGSRHSQHSFWYHAHHLLAAFLYAILLTMKHLYLPLAPLYFVYLLGEYCMESNKSGTKGRFLLVNFAMVAVVAGGTMIVVFLPFLLQQSTGHHGTEQMVQILKRLFPFGRGLVHDYWAANVWAFWSLAEKVVSRFAPTLLPEVTPAICALCLLVGLLPGLACAWKASSKTMVRCVVYCSVSAFMLAYHVHEKAIMTAIIPLTMLLSKSVWKNQAAESVTNTKRLFVRMNAIGLLGLFPLLFRPVEATLKWLSYLAYLALICYELDYYRTAATWVDGLGTVALTGTALFLEIVHPLVIYPQMEFLPLLCTSIVCAFGLLLCWYNSACLMRQK